MNFKHIFASAVIRKVAYTLVALVFALIASLFSSNAKAATYNYPDQGAALAGCQAQGASLYPYDISGGNERRFGDCLLSGTSYNLRYRNCPKGGEGTTGCGALGSTSEFHQWTAGQTCAVRGNLSNKSVRGSFTVCENGCSFQQASPGGVDVCMGTGASMYCSASSWSPTGSVCTAGEPAAGTPDPAKPTCMSTGGSHTECVEPSGRHCVTGAKGSRLCWEPSQVGERTTADGSYAATRVVAPATPTPPVNVLVPTQVATSTTRVNGTTYNTTTYTGTGSTGVQPNTGTGGRTGNGTGTTDGTGQGTGDGDGEGGEDDGNAGAGLGDFYEGSDDTAESVMSEFYDEVTNTPMIDSVTNFMTVSGSGSCPVFTVSATEYWNSMTLDQHCSGAFLVLLQAMGWVIFALACYCAVLIAVT